MSIRELKAKFTFDATILKRALSYIQIEVASLGKNPQSKDKGE